jgi:hypothetical protein
MKWTEAVKFHVTVHPALVLCHSSVPEKVGINQKGAHQKLYSHQK